MTLIIADPLASHYEAIKVNGARLKNRCEVVHSRLAAQSVESDEIIAWYRSMAIESARALNAAATPGIVAYAQVVEDNPGYDVAAELTALSDACVACNTWIETNFPDTNGWLLAYTIAGGVVTQRTFSPAQTAGLRTQIQPVFDAIQ